jgi:IclR family pca regulon transcriptional regulator
MAHKRTQFIQSLQRGLIILQAFSSDHPKLTLSQLVKYTGLNIAAVQRFTYTLMELGFLGRNRHKEFFLGPQVLSLGYAFLQGSELRQLTAATIDDFAESTGHSVNLAILDDLESLFIHRREIRRYLKYDLHPGSKLPAYCSGTGKLLLAALEDDELRRRIKRMKLEPLTSYTLADPERLWADLMETRKRGYSISDREMSLSLYSLGAPVLNQSGLVTAAVNISLDWEEVKDGFPTNRVAQLMELGRQLSGLLGYQGPYPELPVRPSQAMGMVNLVDESTNSDETTQ